MKIAVVGCGAVGSYYGARLTRDGHDVHFLLRSDYQVVRRSGVLIKSPAGDFRVRPRAAQRPEEIGPADLVLIGLKTTANDQFSRLLPPLVGSNSIILTLQNGLGNEEALARQFPPGQILGGLCFVCLNRIAPGVIEHIEHGQIVIGEVSGWPEPRTHDIAALFRHAGVPCKVSDNLTRTHWEKLVWNIPFNGLGVASAAGYEAVLSGCPPSGLVRSSLLPCLTTDQLLSDPKWLNLVLHLMNEVVAAGNAIGCSISHDLPEKQISLTRSMGPYKASTLLDFEKGLPLELESLFAEPLRQAKAAGIDVPRLQSLTNLLRSLDQLRNCSV